MSKNERNKQQIQRKQHRCQATNRNNNNNNQKHHKKGRQNDERNTRTNAKKKETETNIHGKTADNTQISSTINFVLRFDFIGVFFF